MEKLYEDKILHTSKKSDNLFLSEIDNKISDLLIQKQRIDYEKKLETLNNLKNSKGRSAAVFKLRSQILGLKKVRQEAAAIEDPATNTLVFENDEIKSVSLNYLKDLLTNREPKAEYKSDLKVIHMVHKARMNEVVEDDDDLTYDDFCDMLKNLKKNNKEKYRFILKAGSSFLKYLFKLFKLMWDSEVKPGQWENTIAHQLYKGKNEMCKLSNYRFIHTKEEIPKAFEHIVVSKAKPKIVQGCTKFQIGAIPKHQSQEHLFTLKSVMSWYEKLKYFDKENHQDGMNSLYNCGIGGKLYRPIFEVNKKTVLKVKTGVGLSDSTQLGEHITQGSIGGALFSTVNLDYTLNLHFVKSQYEISYSQLRLQPLIFQDDISRLSSSPADAQAGNTLIEACMESKLLDLNTDKSCYVVLRKKQMVQKIESELLSSPLTLCGTKMKGKVSEKYLGDFIHTSGPAGSVHCTISNRYGRIMSGILETRSIIDDCRVNTVGGLQSGIDYWETAYLPSLINNCQTWTDISEDSLKMLDCLQNTLEHVQ